VKRFKENYLRTLRPLWELQGKDFAKRASMWDLLFMGLGSMGRDEGLVFALCSVVGASSACACFAFMRFRSP
jgi:hypothetical protein